MAHHQETTAPCKTLPQLQNLILGTAGHIDHGKTSLIGALTGVQTDRLPEEKKRGITIELGYASLDLPPWRIGIVDVPGHEKFVRQMLAGATGMDIALLVIAGDDSVKQQTTEHLDILRMLELPAGVIALTKCDLVDKSWLDLVEEEIRQIVSGTVFDGAPIIRTSAKTGEGLDQLKAALREACEKVAETDRANRARAPFRMAIDRAFSVDGHGTVVTGSVNSGTLRLGDPVEIQPGGQALRVRGIQNHDHPSEIVTRGQRAAINLAGIRHSEVERGQELAAEGHLVPSELLTVKLQLLDRVDKPLKDRTRIRFHIGTAELFGNVRLLDTDTLQPGQSAVAQIYLNAPAVAVWNQPFVIRRQSPVETIGGGRVLQPNVDKKSNPFRKPTNFDLQMLNDLSSPDPVVRAAASLYVSTDLGWTPDDLVRAAGIVDANDCYQKMLDDKIVVEVPLSNQRTLRLHRARFDQLGQRVIKSLERMHAASPLRFSHPRSALDVELAYLQQPQLVQAVVTDLVAEKRVNANVQSIGLVGYGPQLSKGQRQLLASLIDQFNAAELAPPGVGDLLAATKKNKDSVVELLDMASENGDLVKINSELYFHADAMEHVKRTIRAAINDSGGKTMSEIRTLLNTTRRYAVPLCEYLDEIGVTIRDGDLRVLAG